MKCRLRGRIIMTYNNNPPTLDVPPAAWEAIGDTDDYDPNPDPTSRLLAHVRINDLDMHLEAIAVYTVDGVQETYRAHHTETFDALYLAFGADGPMKTVEIS